MVDRDGVIAAVKSYGQDAVTCPPTASSSSRNCRTQNTLYGFATQSTRGSGTICKQDSDCDQEKGHCDMSYAVRHVGPKTYTDPRATTAAVY